MIPEISEFSYGFALTNELVGWTALRAAPIFPSLIEEGKAGGGYDVKLDRPGKPLFLQFKRADCMLRNSAQEIRKHGLNLNVPFFRFAITERKRSFQHTSLVTLDSGVNLVFYAAPRFHTLSQINSAWLSNNIISRSIFIDPKQIGLIYDDEKHHVSYDSGSAYFCSDPKKIEPLSPVDLQHIIEDDLGEDTPPMRAQIETWLANLQHAAAEAIDQHLLIEQRIAEQSSTDRRSYFFPEEYYEKILEPLDIKTDRKLSSEESILKKLSSEALQKFGAQFFVVQRADSS